LKVADGVRVGSVRAARIVGAVSFVVRVRSRGGQPGAGSARSRAKAAISAAAQGPSGGQVQRAAASGAGEASGDVQQAVA
jgi:hypothetical protein